MDDSQPWQPAVYQLLREVHPNQSLCLYQCSSCLSQMFQVDVGYYIYNIIYIYTYNIYIYIYVVHGGSWIKKIKHGKTARPKKAWPSDIPAQSIRCAFSWSYGVAWYGHTATPSLTFRHQNKNRCLLCVSRFWSLLCVKFQWGSEQLSCKNANCKELKQNWFLMVLGWMTIQRPNMETHWDQKKVTQPGQAAHTLILRPPCRGCCCVVNLLCCESAVRDSQNLQSLFFDVFAHGSYQSLLQEHQAVKTNVTSRHCNMHVASLLWPWHAPASFSNRRTLTWPFSAATCNGVAPVSVMAFLQSAPASISKCTTSAWPF